MILRAWLVCALLSGCGADLMGGDGGGGPADGGGGGGDQGPGPGPGCVPSCAGIACGGDGCGGLCGSCGMAELCSGGACVVAPAGVTVDVSSAPHAIAPEIYGLAFASKATLTALRTPLNRWGGNGTTRYNWELDVGNTANDWFFENIPNDGTGTFGTPGFVSSADRFVADAQALGAAALITVPTIGWTAKDRVPNHPFTCGFPVSKYGAQQKVDPYDTNCGNGLTGAGAPISGDPTNTSKAATPAFAAAWLTHLQPLPGKRYFSLDNEINLWSSTHRDLHPAAVTYDEVWQRTLDYAPALKAADPNAFVMGFGTWSALDVFFSNQDTESPIGSDRKAHGGTPLVEWYLQKLAAYQQQNGARMVDCIDLHYYPQGGDPLETTRSLWDPTYRDPSWLDQSIGEPIRLLPRLQGWINQHYPGTGMCVSEYNFNLDNQDDPAAALVQADVLGLWGKYGVRLAAWWTTPVTDQGAPRAPYWAFKLYRNYDDAGGAFGEQGVGAASSLPAISAFAALRAADGALTVVLINKATSASTFTVTLNGFTPAGAADLYEHVAGSGTIVKKALTPSGATLPVTLAARSVVLVVLRK